MLAYHFTNDRLRDGKPVPVIGETLIHKGPIEWCKSGLYASRKPSQALKYAPGPMLHLVRCEDIYGEQDDKLVCRKRTILKSFDATYLMRRFAADQALSVAHLWDMPEVVRDYLTTLDETKRAAARDAARDAAWSAGWSAGWSATWDATWDAAWDAGWSAVWAAAMEEFDRRVEAEFAKIGV